MGLYISHYYYPFGELLDSLLIFVKDVKAFYLLKFATFLIVMMPSSTHVTYNSVRRSDKKWSEQYPLKWVCTHCLIRRLTQIQIYAIYCSFSIYCWLISLQCLIQFVLDRLQCLQLIECCLLTAKNMVTE